MKTNQKIHSLRLLSLVFLLFFTISAIGQKRNLISNILLNGRKVPQAEINIKKPTDSKSVSKMIRINDPIDTEATIHVVNKDITVVLESSNGTLVEIPGTNIITYNIKNEHEKYELIKSESTKKVVINKLNKYLGSVVATGLTERLQALTRGTIFTLALDGDDLNVKLVDGKLDLNHLLKREIKDENVLGNDGIRPIFIRENRKLTVKDGIYPSPDVDLDSLPILTDENEIKKFLRKPFLTQKKDLLNMGEFSKKAVKDLENVASKDNALISFEKAIDNSELSIEFIIQSALLFADSYLFNEDVEKSKIWLEIGIHYSKILFENKQKLFNDDMNNDNSKDGDIEKALTQVLRYELLTANEFTAWAYDIKLKLNGCLENSSENPSKYRFNADELIKAIDKDN